jgi:hypothetical protein
LKEARINRVAKFHFYTPKICLAWKALNYRMVWFPTQENRAAVRFFRVASPFSIDENSQYGVTGTDALIVG